MLTPDGWSVSEDDIRALYHGLETDGLVPLVFFDGSIRSADAFLNAARHPGNLVVFLYTDRICGFAWLNCFLRHSAFAHFAVLKFAWGISAKELGDKVMEYWMWFRDRDGHPLFQVILGTIPHKNRRAVRFVKSLGFESVGTIPKLLVDDRGDLHPAELMYYERT